MRNLHGPAGLTLAVALAALAALSACGGGTASEPPVNRLPDAASLIPIAPAPQPSATPTPTPPDELWPITTGPGGGGASGSCGEPAPPALAKLNVGVHGGTGDRLLLDSTPIVGADAAYCRLIGYTDGRLFCPVRPEGHPERAACEALRVGQARDTGRAGPTWTVDGRPCDGTGENGSCTNHPTNQFQAYARGAGTYRACAANGACGQVVLP